MIKLFRKITHGCRYDFWNHELGYQQAKHKSDVSKKDFMRIKKLSVFDPVIIHKKFI